MIRVKLPIGGVTPDQLDAFADVDRGVRPAAQGPHHHAPEHPDPPRSAAATRPSSSAGSRTPGSRPARAAATPSATSPATRGPASSEGELFDITPYAGAYVRYFVRHPTTQLMPRKVKTAFTATRRGPRDHRHPRHRASSRACATACSGVEMRVGGGTSIMPRVAPTLYDFVELDNGDYLKVVRGGVPHLRPPGLPARQPRPRPASRC